MVLVTLSITKITKHVSKNILDMITADSVYKSEMASGVRPSTGFKDTN